jgi:hypothetical protein
MIFLLGITTWEKAQVSLFSNNETGMAQAQCGYKDAEGQGKSRLGKGNIKIKPNRTAFYVESQKKLRYGFD